MKVEYASNNSGGHWWLTDKNWQALEAAGWVVDWYKNRTGDLFKANAEGRWLGALASKAVRHGLTMSAAVEEWERVTGKTSTDAGCPCCGQPHTFTAYDDEGKYMSSGPTTNYEAHWD